VGITAGLLLLIYAFTGAEESGFYPDTLAILGLAIVSILAFFAVRHSKSSMCAKVLQNSQITGHTTTV
jgi:hypothetical protein